MRKIAIFVSGSGAATLRIVNLFNEGNRLKTVLVVASDSAVEVLQQLENKDVTLLHVPDFEWTHRDREITDLIRDNDIRLLVLDHFEAPLSEAMVKAAGGEFLKVSTPEEAPREVVNALEADLRQPRVEEIVKPEKEKENPTAEEEWADTLKIKFTPPPVPENAPRSSSEEKNEEGQMPPVDEGFPSSTQFGGWNKPSSGFNPEPPYPGIEKDYYPKDRGRSPEPMPSTYLIWSVLVTIFCCFIPGIVAIIFSSQVSGRYYSGDLEGAKKASRMAEIWIIVSVVIGVVAATLYFPFMLIGG